MKKCYIGTIYLCISVIRAIVLTSIADFPKWVYVVWVLIPGIFAFITALIEVYKDDE